MTSRLIPVAIALACVVCPVGCQRADPLGFTPVTGRATLDGKPLERGEIRFAPDAGASASGPQSLSPLGPGGAFALRGPGGRLGAVPGRHRVYFSMPEDGPPTPPSEDDGQDGKPVSPEQAPQASLGARKVPARYLAPETSGLTATITRGEAARLDFDIVSTPAKK